MDCGGWAASEKLLRSISQLESSSDPGIESKQWLNHPPTSEQSSKAATSLHANTGWLLKNGIPAMDYDGPQYV